MFHYIYVFVSYEYCVFSCVYLYLQKILLSRLWKVSKLFNMKKSVIDYNFELGTWLRFLFGSLQGLLNVEKLNQVKLSGMSRIQYLVVTCTYNYYFFPAILNHLN